MSSPPCMTCLTFQISSLKRKEFDTRKQCMERVSRVYKKTSFFKPGFHYYRIDILRARFSSQQKRIPYRIEGLKRQVVNVSPTHKLVGFHFPCLDVHTLKSLFFHFIESGESFSTSYYSM